MRYFLLTFLLIAASLSNAQHTPNICAEKHRNSAAMFKNSAMAFDYEVVHYNLYIDTIDFSNQEIVGHTGVNVVATLAPVSQVSLDLLDFTIDSIAAANYSITYSYNDTVIDITLSPAIAINDSAEIWVYYRGSPAQDASGWGGFYFSGNHAFNLGVGFQAEPHNFGRAWFPCIDNFTSRSTYDFYINTAAGSKAFCNGVLQQSIVNPDGSITWNWKMNQTIPTYLAGMAVAPYVTMDKISNGIPVQWAALANDTANVTATFANLDTILASFINAYGPYPFDKVGYCLIPFNSGAMEHAASIHIGSAFVNGSQTYSTLWAHELSHMWWGDKVTCETAEDMWLNEGFATYNEAYYTQIISGEPAYREWIRSNHRRVLQFAHTPAQDGSYLTMNAIPTTNSYGFHVYQKGADIVHTLRNYMGDSAFFAGSQAYMNNRAFNHANSGNLRDELTAGSGINMNRFFDDWIFTPGFPHVSIDSAIHVPGGLDHMFVYTRQRSRGNNHLYEIPVELNFSNGVQDTAVTVVIDSLTNMFHIPLYFMPTWTTIDRNEKVSDAISSNEKTITATGTLIIPETNVTINVQSVGTPSSILRVEHNFVTPDPFIGSNPGIILSDYRYWKISGIFNPGFLTKSTFVYDGSVSGTTGFLDNNLITGTEDSLVILYREKAGENWQIVNSYSLNTGPSLTDKRGSFTVDTLLQGEYVIGYYDYTVGIQDLPTFENSAFDFAPNPADQELIFTPKIFGNDVMMEIYDLGGRKIFSKAILTGDKFTWRCQNVSAGFYNAFLKQGGKRMGAEKIIINH